MNCGSFGVNTLTWQKTDRCIVNMFVSSLIICIASR